MVDQAVAVLARHILPPPARPTGSLFVFRTVERTRASGSACACTLLQALCPRLILHPSLAAPVGLCSCKTPFSGGHAHFYPRTLISTQPLPPSRSSEDSVVARVAPTRQRVATSRRADVEFEADNALVWMLVPTDNMHSYRRSIPYLSQARLSTFASCISGLACRFCTQSLVYIRPAFVFVASRDIASSKTVSLEGGSNDDELDDER